MRRGWELAIHHLTPEEFPRTCLILNEGIEQGIAPGMVAGFWTAREPDRVRLRASGVRRTHSTLALPMTVETVFDLASVSKVFATATLAALFVERGWISWETPVCAVLPSFEYPEIRIRHLLAHTSGLPAWVPLFEKIRAHFSRRPVESFSVSSRQRLMRNLVFTISPEKPAGERAVYSDIGFIVLGFLLEEIAGSALDRAVANFLWKPMGLNSAFYNRITTSPSRDVRHEVAATEDCPWRGGILQGQVHDDNCWSMGGYAGHAGAFANAKDVLGFAAGLMSGFLSKEVMAAVWERVERPLGCERTLGWDTPSGPEPSAGKFFSERSVGHLGFTGTSLWIDPQAELAVTLLTNRVHPSRENTKIKAFRPRFHDAIRQDIDSLPSSKRH
ncbi:MAG TPA: serine hydrolase [Bdellovibrionales bacterium]|nr:MAG: hypothetical protein A2Z97_09585 [Bdellovibrionales bacterium GWB1_52_6]OFZ03647.1 MAG: hypothetical protein A2X97_00960 [Bdellovibrionales bacterium GWA1_52_35]OFZ41338.1 MAG: hypothetical protein A2070_08925 [Bdellovibrionales bacterium GWC1_52_8]HAR43907.1 serine hydrolase [Bdellovibrionales bacterium]HCM40629.1 serine hydrolase [Bdellovibrionales bacterium]